MRELYDRDLTAPASLPAGVTPAGSASSPGRALDPGAPAAATFGDVPDHAGHVAAELLVTSSDANRTHNAPACHPHDDPRFPPPAPAPHNGAWIDAGGAVQPWWRPRSSTSTASAAGGAWHGVVASCERGTVELGRFGWRACCPCGWLGPWRHHPLDCGPDLLDHQLDRSVALRAAPARDEL